MKKRLPVLTTEYEISDIPALMKRGWLKITDVGEENTYFELEDGTMGFVKDWRFILDGA